MNMKKVLIVSGHPNLNNSLATKNIIENLQSDENFEFEIDDLGVQYADFNIDVEKEQQKLIEADAIVLAYPIYWYSTPALLQKWMEVVLAHGFAHGSTGKALVGKDLIVSFTTGAPEVVYESEGAIVGVEDMALPLKVMAKMCGMNYKGNVYSGGISYIGNMDEQAKNETIERMRQHALRIKDLLQ